MKSLMHEIRRFLRDEEGATAVEYGMMVALIAAVIVAVVAALGDKILAAFTTIDTELGAAAPPAGGGGGG